VLATSAWNVASLVATTPYFVERAEPVTKIIYTGSFRTWTRLIHGPYDVDLVVALPGGQTILGEVKVAPNPIPDDLGTRVRALHIGGVPKLLNSFLGRAQSILDDMAVVTLLNEDTGDRIESRCSVNSLVENGIGLGDEFRCEVFEVGNSTSMKFTRLDPKPISKNDVAEIRKEFESRWD